MNETTYLTDITTLQSALGTFAVENVKEHNMIDTTEAKIAHLPTLLADLGVTLIDLQSRCRRVDLVDARCLVAATLMRKPHVRQQDIADLFGISQAAVSKLLVRHRNLVESDRAYRQRWEGLKAQQQ